MSAFFPLLDFYFLCVCQKDVCELVSQRSLSLGPDGSNSGVTHILTLTPFFYFFLFSLSCLPSGHQSRGRLRVTGCLCAHVSACVGGGTPTLPRHNFTASGWRERRNRLRDSLYSERGFQCASRASRLTSCCCDASLPCVVSDGVPRGLRWRRGSVGIPNPDYLTQSHRSSV